MDFKHIGQLISNQSLTNEGFIRYAGKIYHINGDLPVGLNGLLETRVVSEDFMQSILDDCTGFNFGGIIDIEKLPQFIAP